MKLVKTLLALLLVTCDTTQPAATENTNVFNHGRRHGRITGFISLASGGIATVLSSEILPKLLPQKHKRWALPLSFLTAVGTYIATHAMSSYALKKIDPVPEFTDEDHQLTPYGVEFYQKTNFDTADAAHKNAVRQHQDCQELQLGRS